MAISWYVQQQFFAAATSEGEALVRLPVHSVAYGSLTGAQDWCATLSANIEATKASPTRKAQSSTRRPNVWSEEEHERFLLGLELFPQGPWKEIAAVVGTRSTRQTMTHAQKYRHKINRRMKWASVLQGMASTVRVKSESCTSQCDTGVNLQEAGMLAFPESSPARVGSPLEVSCETFDSAIDDSDLQDLIDNLLVPSAPLKLELQ